MPVRSLTVVVTRASGLRAALELAAANAALDGPARVFCQGEAVAALAAPLRDARDPDHRDAGLPTLATLFEEALALGVEVIACQGGMALTGMTAERLDGRISGGGLVGMMQTVGEARLVTI